MGWPARARQGARGMRERARSVRLLSELNSCVGRRRRVVRHGHCAFPRLMTST